MRRRRELVQISPKPPSSTTGCYCLGSSSKDIPSQWLSANFQLSAGSSLTKLCTVGTIEQKNYSAQSEISHFLSTCFQSTSLRVSGLNSVAYKSVAAEVISPYFNTHLCFIARVSNARTIKSNLELSLFVLFFLLIITVFIFWLWQKRST